MKSIIAAVLTCAVLFGASYGASTYFAVESPPVDEPPIPAEEKADQESTLPPNSAEIKKTATMQVGPRADKSISLEAVLQMSDSIKKMEERLILREKRLAKEEQRVALLFNDLETEQDALQALSEGVDSKVQLLERMTETMRTTLEDLDTRKTEIESMAKKEGIEEKSKQDEIDDKVDLIKSWFTNLPAEQAASSLKEMANTGRLEFAASLLHKMSDRQKSKILLELKDPVLVNQMIDALQVKPKEKK